MKALYNIATAIDGFGFLYAACRENTATKAFRSLHALDDLTVPQLMRGIAMGSASPLALVRATGWAHFRTGAMLLAVILTHPAPVF